MELISDFVINDAWFDSVAQTQVNEFESASYIRKCEFWIQGPAFPSDSRIWRLQNPIDI
jgi:hypothetical protein